MRPWSRSRPAAVPVPAGAEMRDARTLQAREQDYKVSALLFRRIWRLIKPFWMQRAHWPWMIVVVMLLAMVPFSSWIGYRLSHLNADLTNAIVGHQRALYQHLFWVVSGIGLLSWIGETFMAYLGSRLNIVWRAWLTDWMIGRYLRHRTYYDIALREDLDNPDQRIQEDITPFITTLSDIPQNILSRLLGMLTGGIIIASLSASMTWTVVIFSAVSTVATLLLYTPMIRLHFNSTVAEADLRYGILHVRDNAETVAFYRGEESEHTQIRGRLRRAVRASLEILNYQIRMSGFNYALMNFWTLAPFFLLAPLFFDGKIQYGDIVMGTTAATSVYGALNTLASYIPTLIKNAPSAVRLAQILERFDALDEQRTRDAANTIAVRRAHGIALHDLSLETPGGEQRLVRQLSLTVAPGRPLLICGQTGVGKSSLLRAMAGLWQRGTGSIAMPQERDCFFLPQKPYMILADLRSQLLYPHGSREAIPDAVLQRHLERVSLGDLLDKHGGLDAVRDWPKVLSLGEQQRIGFARVLVARPQYVFLDEATSAVDIDTEQTLYGLLAEIGATFVSVGHRPSIVRFHADALCLHPGGGWEVKPTQALDLAELDGVETLA